MKRIICLHMLFAYLLFCGCSENSASTNSTVNDLSDANLSSGVINDFICQEDLTRYSEFTDFKDEFAVDVCKNGKWICSEGDWSSTGKFFCINGQWLLLNPEKNCNDGELFTDGTFNYVCLGNQWTLNTLESSSSSENSLLNFDVYSSSAGSALIDGILTDYRDGQTYRVVDIGSQTWMAENLKYAIARSGCFLDEDRNCLNYGRLYSWNAAMEACPAGWHLPNNAEWLTLFLSVGGQEIAGNALKSTFGWTGNGGGSNAYGFSAISAGYSVADVHDVGDWASFWSATEGSSMELTATSYIAELFIGSSASGRSSVRCVKDGSAIDPLANIDALSPTIGTLVDRRDGQIYKTVTINYQMIKKTWMAQNLNYKMDSSFCYKNEEEYCTKYGRLYVWNSAMNACPEGWQLPSKDNFIFFNKITGFEKTGKALKALDWYGTDSLLFSALPAGVWTRDGYNYPHFDGEGRKTVFWGSTEDDDKKRANTLFLEGSGSNKDKANLGRGNKDMGYSIRCIKK